MEQPGRLHHTPPRAQSAHPRWSWCKGVFPHWKRFLENLASHRVDGYLNHRLLWLQGIKCKGKVCFHPRSFSKAMEYFVTTLHYTLHREDAPFLKLKEKCGLYEGSGCILFVSRVPAY